MEYSGTRLRISIFFKQIIYIIKISVKMNMRTFHKLSQEILKQKEQNKENSILNLSHFPTEQPKINKLNSEASTQDIILLKKMNAKKLQEANADKERQITNIKSQFEKEKQQLIQKYEKIVSEKEDYIKVLEQLYSQPDSNQPNHHQSNYSSKFSTNRSKIDTGYHHKGALGSQTLYLHQVPLYSDLCYSIQRPQNSSKNTSKFCSTKTLKNRLTSTSKEKKKSEDESNEKNRSQSITRNHLSKHIIPPACPPRYFKIL